MLSEILTHFVLVMNQLLFLVVVISFYLPLSSHCFAAALKLFDVHQSIRFMRSCVPGSSSFHMHFKPPFHVLGVSSVVAAVLAEKNVNVKVCFLNYLLLASNNLNLISGLNMHCCSVHDGFMKVSMFDISKKF